MMRALAVVALTCLPLPAVAEEVPLVDHVAIALLGLQAGYNSASRDVLVPIQQHAPGVFEQSAEGQRTVITTITELGPCVFNYEAKIGTRSPRSFQFNFKSLDRVIYRPRKTEANGLTLYLLEIEAKADFAMADGEPVETKLLLNSVTTDIPLASLEASLAALKAACPTGDPIAAMALVDHVASVALGLQHGYETSLADRAIPMLRVSPGVYEMKDSRLPLDYRASITEVGTCVFQIAQETLPLSLPKVRIDATKLTSVAYTAQTTDRHQVTTYAVESAVEPGFWTATKADGTTTSSDSLLATLKTSAPIEVLDGSVAALLEACP